MSAFYHEVLAFADKYRKLAERGKPKAIVALATKTLQYAESSDHYSPHQIDKIMRGGANNLLSVTKGMKDATVFHVPEGMAKLFSEEPLERPDDYQFKLPYDQCVFIIDVPEQVIQEYEKAHPDLVKQFMLYAGNVPDKDKVCLYTFVNRGQHAHDWTFFNAAFMIDDLNWDRMINDEEYIRSELISDRDITKAEKTMMTCGLKALVRACITLERQSHTVRPAKRVDVDLGPVQGSHRRFYQHRVIVIDPDAPLYSDKESIGCSGRQHALHSVRGFWRTLKNPKPDGTTRVWVKAHWRGNKDLGVISKEYEIRSQS